MSTPRASRLGLILPFAVVGLLLAAWTVWWFVLAGRVEREAEARLAALRQQGWTVATAPLSVDGWPFRVRLDLGQAEVRAPSGHGLSAPSLIAEANAWAPLTWVVIAPDDLTLTRPDKGRIRIDGDGSRLSLVGVDRPWPRLAVEMIRPVFLPLDGAEAFPIARAERITFEAVPIEGQDAVGVLFQMVEARGRAGGPVDGATDSGLLTARVEMRLDEAEALRAPASDDGLLAGWSAAGGRFTQVRGLLESGDARATLRSEGLRAREDGRLEGRIALQADRPGQVLAGIAGGDRGRSAAERVPLTGRDVALTLDFREGRTWLGPFALAPAPKLF